MERRLHEPEDEARLRRHNAREVASHSRRTARSSRNDLMQTKHSYLHEKGWRNPEHELHSQPWVKEAMDNFHTKQSKWRQELCNVCHEIWPTRVDISTSEEYICTRCKRDKAVPKLYSCANDMHPGMVPPCLGGLTQVEQMLIARACPIMSIYRKHGGQWGYKGHVVNLPQDIQGFLDHLPCSVTALPILVVRRHGAENTHADFRVRRMRILSALHWLKANNPCYKDITIDHAALQLLPEDGIPSELLTVVEKEEEVNSEDQSGSSGDQSESSEDNNHDSHSFLPLPTRQVTEDEHIHSSLMSTGSKPVDWPDIMTQPINEFQTPYLATMSFPTLFPYATGDPTYPGRERSVSLTDAFKHLIRYGEVTPDNTMCWRFASHPRFPYWALNMKQRHQLLSQSKIYFQQNPDDASLSVDELKAMIGTLSATQLMKRLQRYAAKVQGSSQYWFQRHQELQALLEQKGPPTFFWTVSSADNYWPELHSLMPHSTDDPTHSMRVQAVISNPHLADWYFTSKLSDFVHHWLYDTLDADWHWYRFEYQARGSTHAHGCAKLKNDGGICGLVEKAAVSWLAEQQMQTCNDEDVLHELSRAVDEGTKARADALQYADWLVTTSNSCLPDGTWTMPVPHPCAVKITNITDINSDYHDLLNSVERHTRCNAAYCLRKKTGQQQPECRFNYPRPVQQSSTLEFEKLQNGTVRATLITRRNDPRVNSHNRVMLQHWRANVDLQIIVDVEACARYMAKYAAKSEPRSKAVHSIFRTCVDSLSSESDARKALRSAMLRSVGERDFSSQETAHMLLSLPLFSCTYNFIAVPLNESRQLTKDSESGELVLQQSILDQYASRDCFPDMSLCEFVSQFTVSRSNICERSSPVIVRTFPRLSPNQQSELYGQYCKYQLIKHKPWKDHPSSAWTYKGSTDTDVTYISAYNAFLQTEAGRHHIPQFASELARAQQYVSQTEDNDEESDDSSQDTDQEDWMLLCHINQQYTMETESASDTVDWAADARALPANVLRECCTWLQSRRKESLNDKTSPWNRQLPSVDISTLNAKQRLAYDIIIHHRSQKISGRHPDPLYMIVCGSAGTGKSYLISAIAHGLGKSCLLTGTTGMASYHICGKTLHAALKLPVRNSNKQDLQGTSLQQLQSQMKDVHYLIIDEMSMIGHRMLAWVDKRLRQATGQLHQPMGGISVILFGDFAQLPPVGDKPLYSAPSSNDFSIHGHTMYHMFTTVIVLDQILRQSGCDPSTRAFRDLLGRLRDGNVCYSDWQMLLKRTAEHADNTLEFADAVRLFYTKEDVARYNLDKLYKLGTPVANINAIHSCLAAASTKPDDAGGLYPVTYLSKQAPVMLTANLWQQVGLCNGAAGTVHQILYQEGHSPPSLPIAVLVDFPNYSGPPFFEDRPICIPIPPILSEWTSGSNQLSRQQLPLLLRFAMTIHKSQGQTLEKAVIDLGRTEFAAGCTFVAVSRLRKLQDALFEPMSFQRLQGISRGKNLKVRINEEKRLQQLSNQLETQYLSALSLPQTHPTLGPSSPSLQYIPSSLLK